MFAPSSWVTFWAIGSSSAQYPQVGLAKITSVGLPRKLAASNGRSSADGAVSAASTSPSGGVRPLRHAPAQIAIAIRIQPSDSRTFMNKAGDSTTGGEVEDFADDLLALTRQFRGQIQRRIAHGGWAAPARP